KTNHFEWGGCERIGGRYYLIGGLPEYFDNNGYAMYTFTADSPEGPFRPDPTAFRLCGNSPGGRLTWLAAWCRGEDDELLISNYSSPAHGDNARPWMLPLRRPLVDGAGHLRLAWWKGNEVLKGEPLPLREEAVSLRGGEGEAAYRTAWLDRDFDLARGVVLEGSLRADGEGPSPAVGFVFDEKPGEPVALLMGVGGPHGRETHIGRLQADEQGGVTFVSEDVTGKHCATVTGIEGGSEHRFRLLVRMTFFELYVDDLLVQTFVYRPTSGRLGFVTRGARLAASGLEARLMSLRAETSFALGSG
ncbi:MAG: hypothetical protein ACYTFI_23490, partial [Planctomycetota bacterium]